MACGEKAGQIDGQSLHIVEGTNSHDEENDEQDVIRDGAGLFLIQQDLLSLAFLHSTRLVHPRESPINQSPLRGEYPDNSC